MQYKNKVLVPLLATGLVVGGAAGLYATYSYQVHAEKGIPAITQSGVQTSKVVESIQNELDRATEEERLHGCITKDKLGNQIFCGKSKERLDALHQELIEQIAKEQFRGESVRIEVEKSAREVAENDSIRLAFERNVGNPYNDKSNKRVEFYIDERGIEYMADAATNKVIQFTNEKINLTPAGKPLNSDELKTRAGEYLALHVADFQSVQKQYTYEEGSKDGMHVFRWNASSSVESADQPFVMVKLTSDGRIIGFSDTRSLYE